VVLGLDVPLDEERHLRVLGDVVDADLLPVQVHAVGPAAVAGCRLAAEPLLDGRDVVDGDRPGQPATALG